MPTSIHRAAIDRVIQKNLKALRKPGVLTVRPGYEIDNGRITGRPAIVVTVERKSTKVPKSQQLPKEIGGYQVDVRQATGLQRLRKDAPAKHAIVQAHGRPEHHEPDWPLERRVSDGKLLSKLPKATHAVVSKTAQKPAIPYAPAKTPLAPATRSMTILACASPDAGFTVLNEFITGARKKLAVAMYDFTSADILKSIDQTLQEHKIDFQMVLDHPPLNPTANQTDAMTAASIIRTAKGATIDWALTRPDPNAAKWIYPTAYHIKVAVRDSSSFWLSSGNWNVSNQPNFAAQDTLEGSFANADRDWHVVITDDGLAQTFESYIANDKTVAALNQMKDPPTATHQVIKDAIAAHQARMSTLPTDAAAGGFTLGAPKVFTNVPVTVQPLLTPDKGKKTTMYIENVLALLKSAKKRIYIQTQYVHPSSAPASKDLMTLIAAMKAALAKKVDVRLIVSQYENTAQYLELMYEAGVESILRVQNRVHNKGIVVDSEVVMVSSQNWSTQGVMQNRDAGVIIHHPDIAKYFEAVFLDDWSKRADVKLKEFSAASLKKPASKKPASKRPVSKKSVSKRSASKKSASRISSRSRG